MSVGHHPSALTIISGTDRRASVDEPLRRAGFTIRCASNGEDGLRMAMEGPDLIVLDLQLPDMSGFEVCCRLKAHAVTASIPVLHLSDIPVESSEFACQLEQGDDAYLTYPVEEVELLSFVHTLIRGRQDRRQFSSFLEATPDAVVICTQEGKIVRVNRQVEHMFGYPREALIGDEIELLLPERFRDDHRKHRTDYSIHPSTRPMRTGLDLWGMKASGGEFPVEISLNPIPAKEGLLIACIIRDVTERRRIEQKSHVSETRYRRLFETAKDGILILDTETARITEANPFMSELLGYSHERFLGKELWEIGLFSDKAANEAAVRTLQSSGYIRYEHLPLKTNAGRTVEVEVVANSYQENDRSVIQCNIRDITERSRLENRMVEQAIALADLDRRKDEFLAMLGHELRNPLAPIRTALQLLNFEKNETPLQQKAHAIIGRQVAQLVRLVDDLLEVARITTGKLNLQREQVSLNEIVERAVESARPLIDQHNHELIVLPSFQSIWIYADANRLEQVVVNLLTNAAKYTADGGQIRLTLQQEDDEAVLTVKDTGFGIAPELLPHIFDLFTQAERSLDRSQGGLGIGLCLVKQLVNMHEGRVEVSSVLGKGSQFVVRLPLLETPERSQPQNFQTNEKTGKPLRVLVVDDNVDATETLEMLLTEIGHDVRTAYDGPTALRAALNFQPNVVLLDIGLPGMDGYEVAAQIRQTPSLKNMILVAMTGYGQESDRQRSFESHFDHHLVKPADFQKLQQILDTASGGDRLMVGQNMSIN